MHFYCKLEKRLLTEARNISNSIKKNSDTTTAEPLDEIGLRQDFVNSSMHKM